MPRSSKQSSTSGHSTGSKSTKSTSNKRSAASSSRASAASSSRVSISYGTAGNLLSRQDAAYFSNLALSRFTDNNNDSFVAAGSFEHNADPMAAVHDRYARRDMVGQLQAMFAPLASPNTGPSQDLGMNQSDVADNQSEGYEYDTFLSLSDDEGPTEQTPTSRR